MKTNVKYTRDVSDVEFQTSADADVYADVILRMQMWMRISVSTKMRMQMRMRISKYDIRADADADVDVFYVKRSHQGEPPPSRKKNLQCQTMQTGEVTNKDSRWENQNTAKWARMVS